MAEISGTKNDFENCAKFGHPIIQSMGKLYTKIIAVDLLDFCPGMRRNARTVKARIVHFNKITGSF